MNPLDDRFEKFDETQSVKAKEFNDYFDSSFKDQLLIRNPLQNQVIIN